MTRIGKYLQVEDTGHGWHVCNMHGELLGTVAWYPRWRRHVFAPSSRAVYSWDCLRDLSTWMRGLDEKRRVTT